MDVSFVIPCLNEEESIATVIEEIFTSPELSKYTFEVLVADNGSTDRSVDIAIELGARVVKVDERGYGAALLGGIKKALGKVVVMADADGSYKFSESGPMINLVLNGKKDLVIGNRFKGGISEGAMPWLHEYIGNPILSYLGRLLYKVKIYDFHCGLRAFNRISIMNLGLSSNGMEFASEMVVKASMANLDIVEYPVSLSKDLRSRPPHLRTWSDGFRHLKLLLRFRPTYVFVPLKILLFVLGIVIVSLGITGPTKLWSREISVRTSALAFAFSLALLMAFYMLELARLLITRQWKCSSFIRFRTWFLNLFLLMIAAGVAGASSQSIRWIDGSFMDSENQQSVLWFFLCLFGVFGGIISIGFLALLSFMKYEE